jgi:hypothetical protein
MTAPNRVPRFTNNGKLPQVAVTAANTKSDGAGTIGTDIFLLLTAGANDSFLEAVRWILTGTVANTASTATVLRIFISTQSSGTTTSANTSLLAEVTVPILTADSSTTAQPVFDVPIGRTIPSGSTILVTNHAAPAANTAWKAEAMGGDF